MQTSTIQPKDVIVRAMVRLIEQLPDRQRFILGLQFEEQFTLRETSLVLDLNEVEIEELSARSRERLLKSLHASAEIRLSEDGWRGLDAQLQKGLA